ncbi:hypothetical protein B0H17DRAFT_1144339 [Mycena rosella]|uniref:Uncharacterized protein n=1 Tax=Mycena rosella TaxID=1033263 RepID=A0AAD7CU39_MYCRO|nr:hypothetical protein B0H17DRAFT_1144339 [Mycena rosella]
MSAAEEKSTLLDRIFHKSQGGKYDATPNATDGVTNRDLGGGRDGNNVLDASGKLLVASAYELGSSPYVIESYGGKGIASGRICVCALVDGEAVLNMRLDRDINYEALTSPLRVPADVARRFDSRSPVRVGLRRKLPPSESDGGLRKRIIYFKFMYGHTSIESTLLVRDSPNSIGDVVRVSLWAPGKMQQSLEATRLTKQASNQRTHVCTSKVSKGMNRVMHLARATGLTLHPAPHLSAIWK